MEVENYPNISRNSSSRGPFSTSIVRRGRVHISTPTRRHSFYCLQGSRAVETPGTLAPPPRPWRVETAYGGLWAYIFLIERHNSTIISKIILLEWRLLPKIWSFCGGVLQVLCQDVLKLGARSNATKLKWHDAKATSSWQKMKVVASHGAWCTVFLCFKKKWLIKIPWSICFHFTDYHSPKSRRKRGTAQVVARGKDHRAQGQVFHTPPWKKQQPEARRPWQGRWKRNGFT